MNATRTKAVNPLAVQIGQCLSVLGQGQCLGLKPPDRRRRGRLSVNSTATYNLSHDQVEDKTVSIVDILVIRQPPIDQMPKQPVEPVAVFLPLWLSHSAEEARPDSPSASSGSRITKKPSSKLSCAPKFQPHPAVKTKPLITRFDSTLWVIHNPPPQSHITCSNITYSRLLKAQNCQVTW